MLSIWPKCVRCHTMHDYIVLDLKECACNLYLCKKDVLQCKKFRKLLCDDTALWSVSNSHYFDISHDLNR